MKRRILCLLLCMLFVLTSVFLFSCGDDDTSSDETTGETTASDETTAAKEKGKVVEVKVTTPPTKTSYSVGDTFDPTGMVVTLVYEDGSTEPTEKFKVKPSGALGLGDTEIQVSYSTKKTTTTVTIASPFDGKGTAEDPYLIKNEDDFITLTELMASTQADGAYYKQTADFDFTTNSDKIGVSDSVTFGGYYDGDGHKIGIDKDTSSIADSINIFPHVSGYVINLGVYGFLSGAEEVAGVARGTVDKGFVANCWSSVKLRSTTNAGGVIYHNVGKVAGCFYIGSMTGPNRAYPTASTTESSSGGPALNLYYSKECASPTSSYTQNRSESTGMALADMTTQAFLDTFNGNAQTTADFVGLDVSKLHTWKLDEIVTLKQFQQTATEAVIASFEGEGTKESPFLIQNENDFVNFTVYMRKTLVDGYYFKQTADLDLTSNELRDEIGVSDAFTFGGYYDGDGHKIGIDLVTTVADSINLFPHVSGYVINLGVYGSLSGVEQVGGVVRGTKGVGFVANCWSSVKLSGSHAGGVLYHNVGKTAGCFYIGEMSAPNREYPTISTTASSSGGPALNLYYSTECAAPTTSYTQNHSSSTGMALADMLTQSFLDTFNGQAEANAKFVGLDVSLFYTWKLEDIVTLEEYKSLSNDAFSKAFDGKGTLEDPYLIKNEDDFIAFTNYMKRSKVDDLYFKQTADLDFTSPELKDKIGVSDSITYGGHYDGDGHSIGIKIETTIADSVNLFPVVSGSVINLGAWGTNTGTEQTSGLVRKLTSKGIVANCWSSVVCDGSTDNTSGLVYHNCGKMSGSFFIGYVDAGTYCYSTSSTTASSSNGTQKNVYYQENAKHSNDSSKDRTDSEAKPLADMLTQAFLDELASKKQESADFVGIDASRLVDWKIENIVAAPERK